MLTFCVFLFFDANFNQLFTIAAEHRLIIWFYGQFKGANNA